MLLQMNYFFFHLFPLQEVTRVFSGDGVETLAKESNLQILERLPLDQVSRLENRNYFWNVNHHEAVIFYLTYDSEWHNVIN